MSGTYRTVEAKVAETKALEAKLDELEREFRVEVKESLKILAKEFVAIRQEFSEMKEENANQHGQLSQRVEVIFATLKAEIEKISSKLEQKITGNSLFIKGLLILVFVISGVLGEAKLHISALFKYLGLDK